MNATVGIQHILSRFAALHDQQIDLGLERIRVLLAKLGNPHLNLPPVIHVAGTNGKGSSIAFLAAMAHAHGLRAHVHTSPHLIRLNERYVLAGREISDSELLALLQEVEVANQNNAATQYELLTATMFLAFSRTAADIVLIEVGLGGELDATNVVQNPVLALITPIAIEHQNWLGSKLSGIAKAKAGIIKQGCPVISAAQEDLARAPLVRAAHRNQTQIFFADEDFSAHPEDGRFVWQNDQQLLDLPMPNLRGDHQIKNASLATAAAMQLGWTQSAIARGLRTANWPARLQAISKLPPVPLATEIWLDGAHNPHAALALAKFIQYRQHQFSAPLHLILAMQRTKDVSGFLAPFAPAKPHIHLVPVSDAPFASQPDELAKQVREAGFDVTRYTTLQDAFSAIPTASRLLITGSLYLAGDVLSYIRQTPPA